MLLRHRHTDNLKSLPYKVQWNLQMLQIFNTLKVLGPLKQKLASKQAGDVISHNFPMTSEISNTEVYF